MNKKRIVSMILSFVMIFNFLTASVQAITEVDNTIHQEDSNEFTTSIQESKSSDILYNVNIISDSPISVERAQQWAKSKNATQTFIDLAPLYERYAKERGNINWALAYVQSAKETGYGRFGGVLDESYHNPCGLKNPAGGGDYDPNAHKRFDNWEQGVIAHLDHLALYAGASDYPKSIYVDKWKAEPLESNETYDPRHLGWYSTALYGKCKTIFDLGGNWAPSETYGAEMFNMYSDLVQAKVLPARSSLDEPVNGTVVTGNELFLKGWGLHPFAIKEIRVSIDGQSIGKLSTGVSRTDVDKEYPGYFKGSNSGFEGNVSLNNISNGNKKLVVDIVATNGSIQTHVRDIIVNKKLPNLGSIDNPDLNEVVTENKMLVRGWALIQAGVKDFKIYVDGKHKVTTTANELRPDVQYHNPQYPDASNSGYKVYVDISDIANGNREIMVEVSGIDGSTHILKKNVTINRPVGLIPVAYVDEPEVNQTITSNSIKVKGWAAMESGIKEVKVYVDGKYKASTVTNMPRPDAAQVYPNYPNINNSGYEVTVDISDITSGSKIIKVEFVANNGSTHVVEKNIDRKVLKPIGYLDEPEVNLSVSENSLYVKGWAAMGSGVKEVKIYVDNKLKTVTNTNKARLDAAKVYPEYPNIENSGYEATVDISDITGGNKIVKVEVVGNDSSTYVMEKTINRKILQPIGYIDEPENNASISSNQLKVRGWTAMNSGVKEINVYVDGKLKGTTKADKQRLDAAKLYPQYPSIENSGYEIVVDITDIAAGNKVVKVEVVGNDGSKHIMEKNFNRSKLNPIGYIDEPANNNIICGNSVKVKGWAVMANGVKEIKVYVDGKYKVTTQTNKERLDVGKLYPQYPNSNMSGYEALVDLSDISNGNKVIKAEVIGEDGSVYEITQNVTVSKEVYEATNDTLVVIDEPVVNTNYYRDKVKIRGWAVNPKGVKEVKVYINNIYRGNLEYGKNRPDVNSAFPGYPSGNYAGYEGVIDISDIGLGKVDIVLKIISNDNKVKEVTTSINFIDKNGKTVLIDAGHENDPGDPGFLATYSGITYKESTYNLQIAEKLKVELEKRGFFVMMTRTQGSGIIDKDSSESLKKRVKQANESNVDFMISIHNNGYQDPSANGFEVFYSTASPYTSGRITEDGKELTIENPLRMERYSDKIVKSKQIAETITSRVSSQLGIKNRGAKDSVFYIPKNTMMPSVLIECGFMTNRSEFDKISNPAYQQRLAEILADTILESI